jgi:hypothetical protein
MRDYEYEVLSSLKKQPQKECSTSEIVRMLEPQKTEQAERLISDEFSDKKAISEGKKILAQLHRKVLYYLNKLVQEKLLTISKIGNKGEKLFRLNVEEGEEVVVEKHRRRIIITRPLAPAMPIEGYEQKRVVYKYEEPTWISRANSLLIESRQFSEITALHNFITQSFSSVNDVIGVNNFEGIIQSHKEKAIETLLQNLSLASEDYGREISFVIDVDNIRDPEKICNALSYVKEIRHDHMHYVFEIRNRTLEERHSFFRRLVEMFSQARVRLNIKNKDLFRPPYILGRAGPYTFDEHEWRIYSKELRTRNSCLVCGQSAISIDTHMFFQQKNDFAQFRNLMLKVARALLTANAMQRNHFHEYFGSIWKTNASSDFMSFSRNYIRFWNYGWKDELADATLPIELIKSAKEEVKRFCASEYVIYQACGMPTRFDIAFAPAFKEFNPGLSEEKFQRLVIAKASDFYDDKMKETLRAKEKLFKIFDGGDRVRFFHSGTFDAEEIVREFGIILSTYKFPLFSYDFGEIRGANLKLTSFFEEWK